MILRFSGILSVARKPDFNQLNFRTFLFPKFLYTAKPQLSLDLSCFKKLYSSYRNLSNSAWTSFVDDTRSKLREVEKSMETGSLDKKSYNDFLQSFYKKLFSFTKDESFIDTHRKAGIELSQAVFLSNEPYLYKNDNIWILEKHMLCMATFKYPIGLQYVYNWIFYSKCSLTPQIYRYWLRGMIRGQSYVYTYKIDTLNPSPFAQAETEAKISSNILSHFRKPKKYYSPFGKTFDAMHTIFIPRAVPEKNGICSTLTIANHAVNQNYRQKVWIAILRSMIALALVMQLVKMGIIWGEIGEITYGEGYRLYVTSVVVPFYAVLMVLIITYLNKYKFNRKIISPTLQSLSERKLSLKQSQSLSNFENMHADHIHDNNNLSASINITNLTQSKPSFELRRSSKNSLATSRTNPFMPNSFNSADLNQKQVKTGTTYLQTLVSKFSVIYNGTAKVYNSCKSKYHKLMDMSPAPDETYDDLKSDVIRLWMIEISKNGNNSVVADEFFTFLRAKKPPFITAVVNKAERLFSYSYINISLIYGTFHEFLLFGKWISKYASNSQFITWTDLISLNQKKISINGLPLDSVYERILASHLLHAMASQAILNSMSLSYDIVSSRIRKILDTVFNEKNQLFIPIELLNLALSFAYKTNDFSLSRQTLVKFCADLRNLEPVLQASLLNASESRADNESAFTSSDEMGASIDRLYFPKPTKTTNKTKQLVPFFQQLFSIPLKAKETSKQNEDFVIVCEDELMPPGLGTDRKRNNLGDVATAWVIYLLHQPFFSWNDYLKLSQRLMFLSLEAAGGNGNGSGNSSSNSRSSGSGTGIDIYEDCKMRKRANATNVAQQGLHFGEPRMTTANSTRFQLFLVTQSVYPYSNIKTQTGSRSPSLRNEALKEKEKLKLVENQEVATISARLSAIAEKIEAKNLEINECYQRGEFYRAIEKNNTFCPEIIFSTKTRFDSIEATLGVVGNMISRATKMKDFDLGLQLYLASNCIFMIYNKIRLFKADRFSNASALMLLPGIAELSQNQNEYNEFRSYYEIIKKHAEIKQKRSSKHTNNSDSKYTAMNTNAYRGERGSYKVSPIPTDFMHSAINLFLFASVQNRYKPTPCNHEHSHSYNYECPSGAQALRLSISILEAFNKSDGFIVDYSTLDMISRSGHRNNIEVLSLIQKHSEIAGRASRGSRVLSVLDSLYK